MPLRLTTFLTLLLFLPQTSQATFVIGAQAGYAYGQIATTSNYREFNDNDASHHNNFGLHGPLAGVFFGYDTPLNQHFILGLETNTNLSMVKWRATCSIHDGGIENKDHIEQKLRFTSDLLIKAGYRYHTLLGYIKTGLAIGSWRFKSVFDSTHSPKPPAFSKNKILPGLKIAIGIEGNMAKNINWGVEYNHTFFKSHTINRPGRPNENFTYKTSPHYGSLILRMMYKI